MQSVDPDVFFIESLLLGALVCFFLGLLMVTLGVWVRSMRAAMRKRHQPRFKGARRNVILTPILPFTRKQ